MTEFKLMLLISLASLFVAEWSGVMQWVKWKLDQRLKPFDCGKCLATWNTLFIFLYLDYGWMSILYAFATGSVTIIINTIYERIPKK